MGNRYANLTLYGVKQDDLVDYLSRLGFDSYVSPTENKFTTMYDSSFEVNADSFGNDADIERQLQAYEKNFRRSGMPEEYVRENLRIVRIGLSQAQSDVGKVSNLDARSKKIFKQYSGTVEGALVCWTTHLSKRFSCPAFAVILRDDSQMWYHLSVNSSMIDEYTTYADHTWQPGRGITTEDGTEIKGGDANKVCGAFGLEAKTNQLKIILSKPHGRDRNYRFTETILNCEALINLQSFPDSIIRHHALALSLGMTPWWVLHLSYSAINKGEAKEYIEDYLPHAPSAEEAMKLLKQAQPHQT
ncbi:hypothetical protein NIES267_28280 [Calothrix parasitica NIES-267]|uniref:Uncharacterized protein n=1 Tax=Calothrix parasitica NIES-267 TaxID=1973488 RepID=A0A1Z4LQ81_9CYAN|nr:hypothetical protein NIES267_28280 [Calothrix parasitica NIES-267]